MTHVGFARSTHKEGARIFARSAFESEVPGMNPYTYIYGCGTFLYIPYMPYIYAIYAIYAKKETWKSKDSIDFLVLPCFSSLSLAFPLQSLLKDPGGFSRDLLDSVRFLWPPGGPNGLFLKPFRDHSFVKIPRKDSSIPVLRGGACCCTAPCSGCPGCGCRSRNV